jgi:hypothetical protein
LQRSTVNTKKKKKNEILKQREGKAEAKSRKLDAGYTSLTRKSLRTERERERDRETDRQTDRGRDSERGRAKELSFYLRDSVRVCDKGRRRSRITK